MTRLPSYSALHKRLRGRYGPAKHHACVWCGRTADQWAYQHTDPDEIHDGHLWSADESHYQAMCRKHHQQLDSNFRAVGHDQCLLGDRVESLREQAWSAVTEEQRAHETAMRASAIHLGHLHNRRGNR